MARSESNITRWPRMRWILESIPSTDAIADSLAINIVVALEVAFCDLKFSPIRLLELRDRRLQLRGQRVAESFLRADFTEQLGFTRSQEVRHLRLEIFHLIDRHVV